MADFEVTSSTLDQKAGELNELNGKFMQEVQNLVDAEAALKGMWEGDANTEFHNAFAHDKSCMDDFATLISKYCEKMGIIASKYAGAEKQSAELAKARKY